MMGDTNIRTVMKHYFSLDEEFKAKMVEGWELPSAADAAREEGGIASGFASEGEDEGGEIRPN